MTGVARGTVEMRRKSMDIGVKKGKESRRGRSEIGFTSVSDFGAERSVVISPIPLRTPEAALAPPPPQKIPVTCPAFSKPKTRGHQNELIW